VLALALCYALLEMNLNIIAINVGTHGSATFFPTLLILNTTVFGVLGGGMFNITLHHRLDCVLPSWKNVLKSINCKN